MGGATGTAVGAAAAAAAGGGGNGCAIYGGMAM